MPASARVFTRDALLVTASHGIAVLRGIVTGYLIARLFPRSLYGEYQLVITVVGTLSILGLPGLHTALVRAIAQGHRGVVRAVLPRYVTITLLGSLILIGIAGIATMRGEAGLLPLFLTAALLFPLHHTGALLFGSIAVGEQRFDWTLRTSLVWSTLVILATIGILITSPSPSLLLLVSLGIPGVIYLVVGMALLRRYPPASGVRDTLQYGLRLTFATLPVNAVWYLDKLLISGQLGLDQLAVFSVALLIPEQVKTWGKELLPVTLVRQARGEDSLARRRKLLRVVAVLTALFALGIAAYIALAPWVFPFLFPNYPEAVILTQVAAVTLITNPATLLPQYLEARGMIRQLQWSHWLAAVVFCILLLLLIPRYGVLGAIIARGAFRLVYVGYAAVALAFSLRPTSPYH